LGFFTTTHCDYLSDFTNIWLVMVMHM
jgi:hypothetical protein